MSANRRELLQKLKLLLCGTGLLLERPKFSPAKTLHDCPGLKVKPATGIQEEKPEYISEDTVVFAFGLNVQGGLRGWCVCTCTGLRQTHAKDPLSQACLATACAFLSSSHSFFFKSLCPQYYVFVFLFNKVWFPLLCGWLFPSDLVQLSPLTSALNVTKGILSFLRSLWPCGFDLVLYVSSILERDNGWGKIKMFREWLVMKWVYRMDDNFVCLPKNCTVVSKKVFLKQA